MVEAFFFLQYLSALNSISSAEEQKSREVWAPGLPHLKLERNERLTLKHQFFLPLQYTNTNSDSAISHSQGLSTTPSRTRITTSDMKIFTDELSLPTPSSNQASTKELKAFRTTGSLLLLFVAIVKLSQLN